MIDSIELYMIAGTYIDAWIVYLFIGFFGAIIASFVHVAVDRFGTSQTLGGRSMCQSCKKILQPWELLPIVSFVMQGGKCTTCNTHYGYYHVLGELGVGILFAGIVYRFGLTLDALVVAIGATLFYMASLYDIRNYILPDAWMIPFLVFGLVFAYAQGGYVMVIERILNGSLIAIPFFCLWAFSRGRLMGFGDIKAMMGIGWWLGLTSGLHALVVSFLVGGVIGSLVLIQRYIPRSKFSSVTILPFGPFLFLGFLVLMLNLVDMQALFPFE